MILIEDINGNIKIGDIGIRAEPDGVSETKILNVANYQIIGIEHHNPALPLTGTLPVGIELMGIHGNVVVRMDNTYEIIDGVLYYVIKNVI